MDIFRVLTRGASVNKQRVESNKNTNGSKKGEVANFSASTNINKQIQNDTEIVKELDFFRNKRIIHTVNERKEHENKDDNENKKRLSQMKMMKKT